MRKLSLDTRAVGRDSTWQISGAATDRPRIGAGDTFRTAASQQLSGMTAGGETQRTTYGGKTLHSPRNRDEGQMSGPLHAYKAPGSPRNQVEFFYIRHNKHGPKEVRLIANRRARASGVYPSPSLANETLAQLSPRGAFLNQRGSGRNSNDLTAVGPGDDWRAGWQKNGTRIQGDGVKWSGRLRKEFGDTSTFVDEPVPLLAPLAANGSMFWQRGQAQQRKTGQEQPLSPMSQCSMASAIASPSPRGFSPAKNSTGLAVTQWPRPEGNPWKSFAKQAKRNAQTYEDAVDHSFGHMSKELMQKTVLQKRNEILTRIPRQWLHKGLTEINFIACRLEMLPSSFGNYAINVVSLMLEHNMLSSLPESVAKMSKLKHLGLTANQFAEFPDVIGKCTALQMLSMQCNKMDAIKASIGYCRELRAVYLKNNPLKKLALSIGALQDLSNLSYDNSETMRIPPYEVGEQGHSAVIQWLKIFYHNIVVNFRCELRKNFLTPRAAFDHFDEGKNGKLDKNDVMRALTYLNIDVKYFEYVWLTLDMDNSGKVDYWEFVDNMSDNKDEVLLDPLIILKPFLPADVIEQSADLVCANPWDQSKLFKHTPSF